MTSRKYNLHLSTTVKILVPSCLPPQKLVMKRLTASWLIVLENRSSSPANVNPQFEVGNYVCEKL